MLPGTPRRPSFTLTLDFGGSAAGAGVGAGVTVAAAGVAGAAGGGGAGGGGGGEFAPEPICAWASQPRIAGAVSAMRAVNIKGATIVRAIVVLLVVSSGEAAGVSSLER